ncbi:MFS general substrate transporter [Glarea lozoyensis ATCC 20868]|uniref:MFS general substrate transporter n=1 Tax=Glarea lozoyensis (strain ATCC 20868 / MF5171) TaxID=1116229 RepID=S3DE76_GLAL2|nr:MFS general substrate transporter [Glarea lozoyensis ATCC 20868]EPE36717.1 MFS general substrate transporter [Glarea lozoyensis ATCC 20868]
MEKEGSSSHQASRLEAGSLEHNDLVDPNIVDWSGPDDVEDPHNWSSSRRWAQIILVSLFALVTNMAPTICAPAIEQIISEFQIASQNVSTLAITIYLLGLAVGPMFMSPLSEVYGRQPVLLVANLLFVCFIVGCALSQDVGEFMIFRFLSGCAGGTPMTLGGGTIADVTRMDKRAVAMALFSLGPLTGPVLGPVIGGPIAASIGWRWSFWLMSILGGAVGIASLVLGRETSPKILLERKAACLRASSGNKNLRSKLAHHLTPQEVLFQALFKPLMLLVRSPVLLIISLYVALVFGLMYLLFTTFPEVFEGQYGFGTATSGLVYLGLGVALVVCMLIFKAFNMRVQETCMKRDGVQQPKAEYRLVLMMFFSPFVGVGLFIYGWSTLYKVHWIVPIIGTSLIGVGAFFVLMPAQLYLVDLFGSGAAASALGANNILRYLSSTFLPLAGPAMYKALGYGWGNTLLGFLSLCFVPAPILFYKYGESLRTRTPVKV